MRAFCIAHAGVAISAGGAMPGVAIDRSAGQVRVLVTSRSDFTNKTPLAAATLAGVANTAGAASNSAMSCDSDSPAAPVT